MRLLLVVLIALVAGGAACGDGGSSDRPEEAVALTRGGGCGEAFLWAADDEGTVVVTVAVEVPRYSTREPVEVGIDLPDPAVDAHLLRGDTDLTRNLCVDVLEADDEPDETIPLTAGSGSVVFGTIPTDVPACGNVSGTLDLTGVEATDGTRIGDVEAETHSIGCFAG